MNKILIGDSLELLKTIDDECVQTCVTSPPYWGLRDYGNDAQLGLEPTPEQYVQNMVQMFREVRRVLKKDGTLWLNLGDSYARVGGDNRDAGRHWDGRENNPNTSHNRYASDIGLKPKDLVGIPWRVALALQADGWYLRQDIIWHKTNPMPESVTDRCTKSHEYIFLMTKSSQYYYDHEAIKEVTNKTGGNPRVFGSKNQSGTLRQDIGREFVDDGTRNKRSVWTVPTKPYTGAHFAVFPDELIKPCVLAGSAKGDIVLDPFFGSGTTGLVALRSRRRFIGIELNPEYVKIANERLRPYLNQSELF
jgi:DNA modification methylase